MRIDDYVRSNESVLAWLEKLEIDSATSNKNLYKGAYENLFTQQQKQLKIFSIE